jgi:probable rRNA maturation factor
MKRKQRITVNLHIMNRAKYRYIKSEIYKTIALETLKIVNYPLKSAEITLVLCDDIFIRELNKRYRNVDNPTDVLSFPMNEEEAIKDPLLGDIVISVDKAKENCRNSHLYLYEEIIYLFVHGLLHLLGFHHEHSVDVENEMQYIQEKMLMYLQNLLR